MKHRYQGREFEISLRKLLIHIFHDSPTVGHHTGREGTLLKLAQVAHWDRMAGDVKRWCQTCNKCKTSVSHTALTAPQRTNLSLRPFRVIQIDLVGPIHPRTLRGNSYIITCVCTFSDYGWLQAVAEATPEEVARFLIERVFFDVCGFPVIIQMDRGSEFYNAVIQHLTDFFGVRGVYGSPYHPQGRGKIESSHNRLSKVMACYVEDYPKTWDVYVPLAQWSWRSTPRASLQGRSPYEVILGMRPTGPFDWLFQRHDATDFDGVDAYTRDLLTHLREVHECVQRNLVRVADATNMQRLQAGEAHTEFAVGDLVYVKREAREINAAMQQQAHERGAPVRPATVSGRLMPKVDPRIFRVTQQKSPSLYFLEDLRGNQDLGFGQPIHIERLLPADIAEPDLQTLLQERNQLRVWLNSTDATGTDCEIIQRAADGYIQVKTPDNRTYWIDLRYTRYEW